MSSALDACGLAAFLRQEPGWEVIANLIADPNEPCYVHAVNLLEVYYDTRRMSGELAAQAAVEDVIAAGVEVRDDLDRAFWEDAGRIKADFARVAVADCFVIALARRICGRVVTSDHHEFDRLVPHGLCPILFFR